MKLARNFSKPSIFILLVVVSFLLLYLNSRPEFLQSGFLSGSLDASNSEESKSSATCDPIRKLAFAKTHKTGSSTLQNILFRFGDLYNLNFALPDRSWMFSFKESFNASMVQSLPPAKLGYDIFAFHSIWNYDEVKKVLPSAKFITLLRDPVNCYESNYVYMGLQNAFRMDINEYAHLKAYHNPVRRSHAIIGKDQLLWDLGLNWQELENDTIVENKIAELDSQFDLVLLAEHFDESLVMLAKLMCWNLTEVRYLKQNARKKEGKIEIKPDSREILSQWLKADYKLYDYFKKKFEQAMDSYGREQLAEDVATLRKLNEEVNKKCVLEKADNSKLQGEFKMALDIVEGYVINTTIPWCAAFAKSEPSYSNQIRKKAYIKLGMELGRSKFATLDKEERQRILNLMRKKFKLNKPK